jgi:hypothetical protein
VSKATQKPCALPGCEVLFFPVTCQRYCTPEHRRMARKCGTCGSLIDNARPSQTLCRACDAERARLARANPEYADAIMTRFRTKAYGLTSEQFTAMLVAQGNRCAICGEPETAIRRGRLRSLCVDHDHVTGAVRSLLCSRCNSAVGLMDDDPERLRIAAAYIDSHRS